MKAARSKAEIVREYGPLENVDRVNGVTFDGERIWMATGDRLQSMETESGETGRAIPTPCDAGTAFDGEHFYQLAGGVIHKIDRNTGAIVAKIPSPAADGSSGLTWAEGSLWVGNYRQKKILQIDPSSGRVLREIASAKLVTGVTFADGELWHGTWEDDDSELRHVSRETGDVIETLEMPAGTGVSGLEYDGGGLFYCGGGRSAKVRAVRKPVRTDRRRA